MKQDDAPRTSGQSDADADIVQHAKDLYELDKAHWEPIFNRAKEDLSFLSDDVGAQWNEQEFSDRTKSGRPALTVDYLSQFVHQVANNIRMNEPSINVIPVGNQSSVDTAKIYKGLIKQISYTSAADEVYDTAATSAIKCCIGFMRVDHDYVDNTTHDQQLLIKREINPFLVFMDSNSTESDGRDQNHCTILEKISVKEFKRLYPDMDPVGFDEVDSHKDKKDDEEIMLAEFFIKASEESQLDGQDGNGKKISRTIKSTTIMRYKLSGNDVLTTTSFPGDYIPIVPVYGEEVWEDGKRKLYSLIRKAKQAQMMLNLWKSLETELLMKQPNAPVMVPEGSIENYMEDWKEPNKSMALRYATTDAEGKPLPPPQRLDPPTIPTGIINASRESVDDIKAAMGMYNASLGKQGNELSGVAINARKIEGDVATYHFGDNLVRSITQIGRILVCAAPVIYDTARLVQILNEEDEPEMVGINGATAEGQQALHMFAQGKYDVRVVTGASFTTKRQEAAQFFEGIVKQQPQLMQIMGDLLFKNMDFAGAEQMASRMKKTINPALLAGEDGNAPVDPQVAQLTQQLQQAQQAMQQMQAQGQQLEMELKNKQGEVQVKAAEIQSKSQLEQNKMQLDAQKLQLDAQKLQVDLRKIEVDAQKVAVDKLKVETDMQLKSAEIQLAAQPAPLTNGGDEMGLGIHELQALIDGKKKKLDDEAAAAAAQQQAALLQQQQAQAQKDNDHAQNAALAGAIIQAINNLTQAVTAPKTVHRDPDGKIMGVH